MQLGSDRCKGAARGLTPGPVLFLPRLCRDVPGWLRLRRWECFLEGRGCDAAASAAPIVASVSLRPSLTPRLAHPCLVPVPTPAGKGYYLYFQK